MKSRMNRDIDVYISKARKWQEEIKKLRTLLLACHLTEEVKWGKPCYTFEGSNVVIILPLKNYCTLLFCKGALLKDPKGMMIQAGENTQAARQVRFTSVRAIREMASTLKAYVSEAIEAERAGLDVVYKKIGEFKVPEEFQKTLEANRALKMAFEKLTPGRRRAYLMHFAAPKQARTRESRIEKCVPQILKGVGLNDLSRAKMEARRKLKK